MVRLYSILIILLFLLPINVAAEKVVFVVTDYPPYQYEDKGEITGMDTDIAIAICSKLEIKPEFVKMPFKRMLYSMEKGTADGIFSLTHSKEREKIVYYPLEPMNMVRKAAFILKKRKITITGIDDLKGKNIGVISNYTYGEKFDNYKGLTKTVCNSEKELIRMLHKDRIDVAVSSEGPFRFISKRIGLSNEFEMPYILTEHPKYICFSKAIGERGKSLTERFNKVVVQLKDNGTIEKIMNKYR